MNSWWLAQRMLALAGLISVAPNESGALSYSDAAKLILSLDVDEVLSETISYLHNESLLSDAPAADLQELIRLGQSSHERELIKSIPKGIQNLLEISGLKTQVILELYELGIETPEELLSSIKKGLFVKQTGFGSRFSKQLESLLTHFFSKRKTLFLSSALRLSQLLIRKLKFSPDVLDAIITGELRRGKEVIDRIDLLVTVIHPRDEIGQKLCEYLDLTDIELKKFGATGLFTGIEIRIYLCRPEYVGSALAFSTGTGDHYQRLVTRATHAKKNRSGFLLIRGDEEVFYSKLKLPFIPPEIREWSDSIEQSELIGVWNLVSKDDIRGDLHIHTNWSDGRSKLPAIVFEAETLGLEYLAITDHASKMVVTKGLNEPGLVRQMNLIRHLNALKNQVKLIPGIEFNIDLNGGVDFQTRHHMLSLAGIHTSLGESSEQIEQRYIKIINSGLIHIIAHPTTRKLGVRMPLELDWERVFNNCASCGVAVEFNYASDRLDPPWQIGRIAKKCGCKFTLGGDIHHVSGLRELNLGVMLARRAGLSEKDVLNCLPYEEVRLLSWRGS